MLVHRRRRWTNIEPTMAQCIVIAGMVYVFGRVGLSVCLSVCLSASMDGLSMEIVDYSISMVRRITSDKRDELICMKLGLHGFA